MISFGVGSALPRTPKGPRPVWLPDNAHSFQAPTLISCFIVKEHAG